MRIHTSAENCRFCIWYICAIFWWRRVRCREFLVLYLMHLCNLLVEKSAMRAYADDYTWQLCSSYAWRCLDFVFQFPSDRHSFSCIFFILTFVNYRRLPSPFCGDPSSSLYGTAPCQSRRRGFIVSKESVDTVTSCDVTNFVANIHLFVCLLLQNCCCCAAGAEEEFEVPWSGSRIGVSGECISVGNLYLCQGQLRTSQTRDR